MGNARDPKFEQTEAKGKEKTPSALSLFFPVPLLLFGRSISIGRARRVSTA
jgi:hypothetical protein